jgi:hypothetical protein
MRIIPRWWRGSLTGTNRGALLVLLSQREQIVTAKILFKDQQYGYNVISAQGKLEGNILNLAGTDFNGIAQFTPVSGNCELKFNDDFSSARGEWKTDLGTIGTAIIYPITMNSMRWNDRLLAVQAGLWLRRRGALIYTLFLATMAILDSLKVVQVSYPGLILLLLPSPYIFRGYLWEFMGMLHQGRVKKIGPVEIQLAVPAEPTPASPLAKPISEDSRKAITEATQFLQFDIWFVDRTKRLVLWLAQVSKADSNQVFATATALGVPQENMHATIDAIIRTGCAIVQPDGVVQITELGKKYAQYVNQRTIGDGAPPNP